MGPSSKAWNDLVRGVGDLDSQWPQVHCPSCADHTCLWGTGAPFSPVWLASFFPPCREAACPA